jgi:hypothetical protein
MSQTIIFTEVNVTKDLGLEVEERKTETGCKMLFTALGWILALTIEPVATSRMFTVSRTLCKHLPDIHYFAMGNSSSAGWKI